MGLAGGLLLGFTAAGLVTSTPVAASPATPIAGKLPAGPIPATATAPGAPQQASPSQARKPRGGAAAVVDYAYAQLGDRYTYGGDGPHAFDCSGLSMMAWRQAGVRLPHSSRQQAERGKPVGWGQLRPGDLMFFYNPIHHVGIYVGDGQMIAASNPEDDVELVNVEVDYWRDHFTTARRY